VGKNHGSVRVVFWAGKKRAKVGNFECIFEGYKVNKKIFFFFN
jgi:hypothetical protein